MIKLSLRLETILEMTPVSVVADVGSDHGKLMIALYESGKITHGYAIENKKGPYDRLVKALSKEKLEDIVVPLFSDGISELPSCVNTVIIAGMGGDSIIKILKDHPKKLEKVQTIIIDAHSQLKEVRDQITKMGFIIADERMIKEEEIYYEIIRFIRSEIAFYSEEDLTFGPILRVEKNAAFKEKYHSRIAEIDHLMRKHNMPASRLAELKREKDIIEGII
ncbi:MAG TPA: class I SAM-dependent methyltransferase [Bacilli bacterium]|nr:class I SAM-dependent methyltransferase [Bacilli bacterium]HPS19291.1 class I SAM-dependent methyltransferase [Bacilli bacterium]